MKNFWFIRAGQGGFKYNEFKKNNIVSIGWNQIGKLSDFNNKEDLKNIYASIYTNEKQGAINMNVGQAWRFGKEIKYGDNVITYDKITRNYLIGEISSEYKYNNKLDYPHYYEVIWKGNVNRDNLSIPVKYSLGSISSIFQVNIEAQNEIINLLNKPNNKDSNINEMEIQNETFNEEIKEDIQDKSLEFIKDKIIKLDPYLMQDLIAGVLRAIGYKTKVSPPGPDGGKDIIATKDDFGFEEPTIYVEVKHRQGSIGRTDVQKLIGAISGANQKGCKGLFVSTGGFNKNAIDFVNISEKQIVLVDLDYLTQLVIDNYHNFDIDAKSILPLTKIYWPI